MKRRYFPIIIEQDFDGVSIITCPVFKGCHSYVSTLGEVHRLENPGKIPLDLIEVQSGSYLGEDDIVRMEEVYGS